jgi:hypothetical protein
MLPVKTEKESVLSSLVASTHRSTLPRSFEGNLVHLQMRGANIWHRAVAYTRSMSHLTHRAFQLYRLSHLYREQQRAEARSKHRATAAAARRACGDLGCFPRYLAATAGLLPMVTTF